MRRTIVLLTLSLLALTGCHKFGQESGSGVMKVEKRNVSPFKAVNVSGAYDVEIVVQKDQNVELEGDDNLLSLIQTNVRDGVLEINNSKGLSSRNKLRLRISLPSLEAIYSSGASDIHIANVKSDEFDIDVSGAGSLRVTGETKSLGVKLSGAGDVDAKDLHASKVTVTSSGAATADVYASEELIADVSGAGNVNYYGDPKTVKEDTSGAGSVTKR